MRLFDHPAAKTPAKNANMPMTPTNVSGSRSARHHAKNAIHASATKNMPRQKAGLRALSGYMVDSFTVFGAD